MLVKALYAAALVGLHAWAGFAHAQITMPPNSTALGLQVNGPTQSQTPGIVTLGQAALATTPPSTESTALATAATAQNKRAAVQPTTVSATPATIPSVPTNPPVSQQLTEASSSTQAQQPGPMKVSQQQVTTPLPSPYPVVLSSSSKVAPDVTLVRISTKNGVLQATLTVRGITRSGLIVGSKVLKQVISEFRDDGICLDTSLHRPKCATFITGDVD